MRTRGRRIIATGASAEERRQVRDELRAELELGEVASRVTTGHSDLLRDLLLRSFFEWQEADR